jgi:hypothetical protein
LKRKGRKEGKGHKEILKDFVSFAFFAPFAFQSPTPTAEV